MRAGFFLGDGAGVGKGRTIAACIKEHFAAGHGTRALWVSVSKDLNFDAQRDLDDVRAETCVYPEVGSAQLITACMSAAVLITARRSALRLLAKHFQSPLAVSSGFAAACL